jgi:hypothetical protein
VVGQVGGSSLAVAVQQDRAYLGVGPRLVVLDALSAPDGPRSIGQSEVLPGIVQDLYVAGDLVYVAAGDAGLIVLDVADPANIQTLGVASIQGYARGLFVLPKEGLAYVAGAELSEPASGKLYILDVSQPEAPAQVSSWDVPGLAYDLWVADRFAFVAHDGGLSVVDVSDPAAPAAVADLDLPQGARAVALAADHVYLAGDGLHVVDVSDPAQPRPVSHVEGRFSLNAVAVHGERAYLAETFCEMGHCGTTISIVDVSDPADPQAAGVWQTRTAVEDLCVLQDRLYLASREQGLQAVDVSDPSSPALSGAYDTLSSVEDVAVSNGLAFISDEAKSGLRVLDLGGLPGFRLRGVAPVRWAGGYTIADGYAYVPVWVEGFRIVDVHDPDAPQEIAAVGDVSAEQVVVLDGQAYVTIGDEGLAVLDVSDLLAPRILVKLSLGGFAEGLAVAGDQAYVAAASSDARALYIIDVSDPAQPVEAGRVALQGRGSNVAVDAKASYAYAAVADCAYHQCSGGLQVIDLRDPGLPQTVVWVEMPGGAFDVAVVGQYAYVAAGAGGVWVLDLSDPEQPRAIGYRDTAVRARSIVVADDQVYVADGAGGLLVLQVER